MQSSCMCAAFIRFLRLSVCQYGVIVNAGMLVCVCECVCVSAHMCVCVSVSVGGGFRACVTACRSMCGNVPPPCLRANEVL